MPCLLDESNPAYISDQQLQPLLANMGAAAQAHLRRRVACHNQTFVTNEVGRHRHWFDTVEKMPLTSEQRKAVVVMQDRNLLVAAAGSGKTSTMVAKVAYALRTGLYTHTNILVLAFNTKAARELSQRMHDCLHTLLPVGQFVQTRTFHALGLDIITTVQGRRPSIQTEDGAEQSDVLCLKDLISRLVRTDAGFVQEWMLFRLFYCRELQDPSSFSKRRHWRRFVFTHGTVHGGRWGFLTFQGELVQTQCEQAVANWLYLYGLSYVYKDCSPGLWRRFWRCRLSAGFFLTESRIWIHTGSKPYATPPSKYGIRAVLGVSFHDLTSGRLFRVLRHGLRRFGVIVRPTAMKAVIQHLGVTPSAEELQFLSDFIKHARTNQVSRKVFQTRVKDHVQAARAGVLRGFLVRLMRAHGQQFRSANLLDFPEMLSVASQYVGRGRYVHPYTLILVDEFQDTSQASAGLLTAMLNQAPSCKLFAVGDDWQSIYRFAGADNRLFTDFQKHFGATAINYLSTSFRFNQVIADVATKFIQKNPQQIKKHVRAVVGSTQESVLICPYRSQREFHTGCNASLANIQQSSINAARTTVYVLARYRHQLPKRLAQWQARYPALSIQFMTIHAAKGLEADYVLVLGLHGGHHAFPARIRNDPLLQLVMPEPESWPDAEERRLLYVAITRARHKVYLIADMNDKSDFVAELAGYSNVGTLSFPNDPLPPGASRF